MHWIVRRFAITLALINLTGCAGLTAKQASVVSQFNQAAHMALAAESAFLDAVAMVNCEDQYYAAALAYSQGKSGNFDLNGTCQPTAITPAQIATRKALLDALSLYADKMQALVGAGDDQALDQNSIALAKSLNGFVQAERVRLQNPGLAQGVDAALESISKMALDQVKYKDVRTAAQQMQVPIETVVATLVSENNMLGQFMEASLGHIRLNLKLAIAQAHGSQQANTADTFFQIVAARRLLMRANPLRQYAFVSPGSAPAMGAVNDAKLVNDALEAIVATNREIAKPGATGARAAVTALYQRALSARDIYKSIAQ